MFKLNVLFFVMTNTNRTKSYTAPLSCGASWDRIWVVPVKMPSLYALITNLSIKIKPYTVVTLIFMLY